MYRFIFVAIIIVYTCIAIFAYNDLKAEEHKEPLWTPNWVQKPIQCAPLEQIAKIVQAGTSKSMQAGHTELNKIKTRIEALYTPLASKIVNGCDAFISKEEIVTDADTDELSIKKQKRARSSP